MGFAVGKEGRASLLYMAWRLGKSEGMDMVFSFSFGLPWGWARVSAAPIEYGF
jgi:hypothetical protein